MLEEVTESSLTQFGLFIACGISVKKKKRGVKENKELEDVVEMM